VAFGKESAMELNCQPGTESLRVDQFPRSSKYDPEWVFENEMGPNALWLTEALCQVMELEPGMRVLDMGCGRAMSSIFLAKEFGVQVWATDLWVPATDNWQRICAADVADRVYPIHAEAHALPFPDGFFDAIVSLDSYHYYGTDDLYLGTHFARLGRPGAQIGIVVPGLVQEFDGEVPEHLQPVWEGWCSFHTAAWWQRHWELSSRVTVEHCDALPDGWRLWMQWTEARDAAGATKRPNSAARTAVLRTDGGRYLGFVRMVARTVEPRP
jgi:cyclopropane fatty-acyl-phospholipid synthase-like methyltransferase